MENDTNRIVWRLKSKPNMGFGADFKSVIIKNGFVIIKTYLKTEKFKYEDVEGHIAIWPRKWPGANPLEIGK